MGLRGFMRVVGARAWMVVATAVVVTLVAIVVSSLATPTYAGEATVLLTLTQQSAAATILGSPQYQIVQPAREVLTQLSVMRSRSLLTQVIDELGLQTTPAELLKRVDVTLDGETNIVTIEVTDTSPRRAADTANALAAAYVDWSRNRQRDSIRQAIEDVEGRVAAAQETIRRLEAARTSDGSDAVQVQLDAATSLYTTLTENLEQLKVLEQLTTGSGSVLSTAAPDPMPVEPRPVRNAALGLALGTVLGLGMAFVADAMDTTIRSSDQAEQVYGVPVLCRIPLAKRKKRDAPTIAVTEQVGGAEAEAYRRLRQSLAFIQAQSHVKTLLVTSAEPGDGKSTVASNLAVALSIAGKTVALVQCDFHRPQPTFGVEDGVGLSEVLSGTESSQRALRRPSGYDRLWVLPSGSAPANPSELLGSPAMGELIGTLGASADWVILDSAPLLAVSDAMAMARWVDGVLVVVRADVSKLEAARAAREQLERVGGRILGVVLWGLKETTTEGGYGYYAGYGTPSAE